MGILERMPILESSVIEESKKGSGVSVGDMSPLKTDSVSNARAVADSRPQETLLDVVSTNQGSLPVAKETAHDLLDLVFGDSKLSTEPTLTPTRDVLKDLGLTQSVPAKDPLADLFNVTSVNTILPLTPSLTPSTPLSNPLLPSMEPLAVEKPNSFGSLSALVSLATTPVTLETSKKYICFDKKGLMIELKPVKESDTELKLTAVFEATSSLEITNITLQVAVPKVYFYFERML
jgi:hypothetical protein